MYKIENNFCPKELLEARNRYMKLIPEKKNAREEWDAVAVEATKRVAVFKDAVAIYRAAPSSSWYGEAVARKHALEKMAELVATIDDILEYLKYDKSCDPVLKKWIGFSLLEIERASNMREAKIALKRAPSEDCDIYRKGFAKVLFFCTTRSKITKVLRDIYWRDPRISSFGVVQMCMDKVIQLIYQISDLKEIASILNEIGWVIYRYGDESREFWKKAITRAVRLCQSKDDIDNFCEWYDVPYDLRQPFKRKEKRLSAKKE